MRLLELLLRTEITIAVLILLVCLVPQAFLPENADAETQTTECYEIEKGSPQSEERAPGHETWCYKNEPGGKRLVYHVDRKGMVRPELSFLIDNDGTLKHVSLNSGKLTVHSVQVDANWNPFGIPLSPKAEGAKRVPEPIKVMSSDGSEGVISILNLIGSDETDDLPFKAKLEEGRSVVKADYLPWRSFWYPQSSGRLHNGEQSPMAKYDQFVKRRIGVTPEAQVWEKRLHPPRKIGWAGHCNGWSASSIMRPEPTGAIKDPFTGVTFTVADQKGLWLEVDYCPAIAFFGHRNYGEGADGDIRAVDFHNVVAYYIGELKKPIVMDLMNNTPVENRVVSGYDMRVTRQSEKLFRVSTTLTIHAYDNSPNDEVGPAGIFTRTYSYLLEVDEEGRAVAGRWLSNHPDFFWVPLAPAECEDKNPVVHEAWMQELHRLSQRQATKVLLPVADMMPAEATPEAADTRKPGAAPKPDSTPPPAERQPDEGRLP